MRLFLLLQYYTKYGILCHMVFFVIVVNFLMTPLMNKFMSIVMNDIKFDAIYIQIIETKFGIFGLLIIM